MSTLKSLLPIERIEKSILLIRGHRVMLDSDLAQLYGVTAGNLNKAVTRNTDRFPEDFAFRLTKEEDLSLRFRFGSLKRGQHSKYPPRAFTQEGVAMLSGVLNSKRAIYANVQIMRVFIRMRQLLASHKGLMQKILIMEKKYDEHFKIVFEAIRQLMIEEEKPKEQIGFKTDKKDV